MATTSSLLEGVPGWRVRERQSPLPAPCKCPRNLKSLTARGIKVLVLGAFSVSAFGLYSRRPAPWPTDTQGRPYESADGVRCEAPDGTAHGDFEWQRCFGRGGELRSGARVAFNPSPTDTGAAIGRVAA